ncbi:hypothetical protein F4818DRAFT_145078 [Hypoxylon cercidicola]|nr:hypothetical protein F4818DRAFT_145078 [Hypoxylon cercidicola]
MNGGSNTSVPRISCVLDLPDEILKEICKNCTQNDWICLSLVCKRFRDLAASQLYRNFHIVFPDEDDPFFDSPIDDLAGGLHTFTTSDYNYAKHLREICLETLSIGKKAEAAYKPYHANVSCGKFMNTLMLLTLRKAQSLDSFQWNIRVELDSTVYKALHNTKTLRHLHLRLQEGPTIYKTPSLYYPATHYPASLEALTSGTTKNPSTIGSFQNLETLAVLDIDSLDIITELKACIRNSSSSLRKLKLSFSDRLSMQARRLDPDPYDFDDGDIQILPLAPQARLLMIERERKAQESVLGRIFEVEPFRAKKIHMPAEFSTGDEEENRPQEHRSREGQRFIDEVSVVFSRMVANFTGVDDFRLLEQYDGFKTIVKAAKKYVDETDARSEPRPLIQGGADSEEEDEPSLHSDDNANDRQQSNRELLERLFSTKNDDGSNLGDMNTEDNIGDELLTIVDELTWDIDIPKPKGPAGSKNVSTALPGATDKNKLVQSLNEDEIMKAVHSLRKMTDAALKDARKTLSLDRHSQEFYDGAVRAHESLDLLLLNAKEVQHELKAMEAEKADAHATDARRGLITSEREQLLRNVNQYARDTRGISLHSLSIHLIPIRASVLGKAIDLHSLKRITLLNVGEQKKFWGLMMKENKLKPLPLLKIFTDDVSLQFLQLVSELDRVTEVFMLRRSPKSQPESFAPTLDITIGQIRNFILKKHLPTLQQLMIKNLADNSWDIDAQTMRLICVRGQRLKELAVSVGMHAIHTFIQNIGYLKNLQAFQIVSFRADDACLSVMRETRHFIGDAVCTNAGLKLEWLAIGEEERATRIVRKQRVKKSKRKEAKGKEHITGSHGSNTSGYFPAVPMTWDPLMEGEDDEFDGLPQLPEIELVEGVAFYDVYGIRIFKKEIVAGKL